VRSRLLALAALVAFLGGGTAAALVATGSSGGGSGSSTTTAKKPVPHKKNAPEPRIVQGPHDSPVPILMYHVLAEPPASAPYPHLYVPPAEFEQEVRWLREHGYRAVTLDGVWRAWHDGGWLPRKPVVLSFDDGYLSDVRVALPVLRSVRWPGVLNLEVDNLKPVWGVRPYGIHRLIHAGWEIDFFCYPSGRYDAAVLDEVRAARFLGAETELPGVATPADDPFELPRIRIDGGDGVAGLAAKLGTH
jgi:peptidoglycan/xylan/chitin deacetylase (PgdA/CDA1 family)